MTLIRTLIMFLLSFSFCPLLSLFSFSFYHSGLFFISHKHRVAVYLDCTCIVSTSMGVLVTSLYSTKVLGDTKNCPQTNTISQIYLTKRKGCLLIVSPKMQETIKNECWSSCCIVHVGCCLAFWPRQTAERKA